jgi:DNA-binding transcriptional regulator YdaS (Cro superfamily)
MKAIALNDYITNHYAGKRIAMAADVGVEPSQVTQWLKRKYIVVDGMLYSSRRRVK